MILTIFIIWSGSFFHPPPNIFFANSSEVTIEKELTIGIQQENQSIERVKFVKLPRKFDFVPRCMKSCVKSSSYDFVLFIRQNAFILHRLYPY